MVEQHEQTMSNIKYERLSESDQDHTAFVQKTYDRRRGSKWYIIALILFLMMSLSANLFLVMKTSVPQHDCTAMRSETKYAGLSRSTPVKWTRHSPWHNDNKSEEDTAWNEYPGFNVREAIIALPNIYSQSVNLPSSQRWPWDDSKGIYFLEGLHCLHCVKYLRTAMLEAYEGRPFSMTMRHLKHCIEALRQFVMCNADDTPRYTGRLHDEAQEKEPAGGVGQVRMCRNWDQYMSWVTQHSACYRWIPGDSPGFRESDRYKSCPDGSVHW